MGQGIYTNNFKHIFNKLLDELGVSCHKLSKYTHLDQGLLSRLRSGEDENPSPESLMKICIGFVHFNEKVALLDAERIFNSVGRSLGLKRDLG